MAPHELRDPEARTWLRTRGLHATVVGMNRRMVGGIVGAVGALSVAASASLTWFGGRDLTEVPLAQLIDTDDAGTTSAYSGSVAAALAIVGVLGVLGALARSRFLLALGLVVGAGAVGLLWLMLTMGDTAATDDPGRGLLVCVAGLAVLLIGIFVMGPRREAVEAPLSVFDGDPPQ